MAVYKRGEIWWYKFNFNTETVRKSTKQSNKRTAEQMEAAHKTQLAKGEVGIEDRQKVPTLQGFAPRFRSEIEVRCAEKPRTISFYKEKLARLLEYQRMASARLDHISEELIGDYVQFRRRTVAPATVNRQLATLRRALRMAYHWKIINRLPKIQMLQGERDREFVLSPENERLYLAITPHPLNDMAVLLLDTGMRIGEALALQWPDVHFEPATGAKSGYIHVRDGKSKFARRNLSMTQRARAMLTKRAADATTPWVFASRTGEPYLGTSLNHIHTKLRDTLKLPKDFVLHSLRHTMLTRLGETGADAFTIMRIAGHSSITVSQKYVHPTPETLELAFERLEAVHKVGTNMGTVKVEKKAKQRVSHSIQ
jgi:integrase